MTMLCIFVLRPKYMRHMPDSALAELCDKIKIVAILLLMPFSGAQFSAVRIGRFYQ